MSRSDNSVSYLRERFERFDEPTKVKNGLEGPGGDIQIPIQLAHTHSRLVDLPFE